MKILHIFPKNCYHLVKDYYEFIINNYNLKKHYFAVIGKSDINTNTSIPQGIENIKYFDSYKNDFINIIIYLIKFDKIIYHSLCIPAMIKMIFLFIPFIMKKIVWIAWGYDLYQWKEEKRNSIKYKLYNLVQFKFRRRIKYFVGIFQPDIIVYKHEFGGNAKTYYAPYMISSLKKLVSNKDLKNVSLFNKIKNNYCINIQIGNSCSEALNHIEVLRKLYKYKNENIKIFIPLSYGIKEYGDKIEEKAKLLFGEKVECIRNFLSSEEYGKFLSTIDIAIFNVSRQIALGNIYSLMYKQKKIYIPSNTVMYDFFRSLGIKIFDYNKIENMDFNDFTRPVDMGKAKLYVESNIIDKNKEIEMWSNVFNDR